MPVGRGLAVVGLLVALAAPVPAAGSKAPPAEELTNFQLGPEYAQWLVGPIDRLATEEERRQYLALADDGSAQAFIADFWARRGGIRAFPPTPGHVFEQRRAQADVLYREGARLGHRTDRGTIYVLYGPPTASGFEASPSPGGEPVELWLYRQEAAAGLDGERPKRQYAFRRQDGVTSFYPAPIRRQVVRLEDPPGD